MRFSRPLVPVVATAALAMVSLTACGGGSSSGSGGGGGKLDVFLASQPNYPTQFQQWSSDVKAQFKAVTGADLTIETFSSAADETTKIQASVVSGNGPDVYQLGTTFTPVAYGTKAFHTLTDADWQKVGGKDQYVPESLGMSGPDSSTQIGIPVAIRPFGMVYNTEMFKAAGITQPPTTWDDLVAAGKKLTTGDQSTASRSATPTATTPGSSSGRSPSSRAGRSSART